MAKPKTEIDQKVYTELLGLPWPLPAIGGKFIFLRQQGRGETGAEHIAAKRHHLKIVDIRSLPALLKAPIAHHSDSRNKNYVNYYGRRKGNKNQMFLKVITSKDKHNKMFETLITLYPTKKVK